MKIGLIDTNSNLQEHTGQYAVPIGLLSIAAIAVGLEHQVEFVSLNHWLLSHRCLRLQEFLPDQLSKELSKINLRHPANRRHRRTYRNRRCLNQRMPRRNNMPGSTAKPARNTR